MRLLLEGLFNIGFNHQNFRDEFLIALNSVKDSKKIIRGMREWIKEGDKMYSLVRSGKL